MVFDVTGYFGPIHFQDGTAAGMVGAAAPDLRHK